MQKENRMQGKKGNNLQQPGIIYLSNDLREGERERGNGKS